LWTTAITAAELRAGVAALPEGRRKRDLHDAIEAALHVDLGNRVLPFDDAASVAFAAISARRRRSGSSWDHMDLLIAAIAAVKGATVATRNTIDFEETGVPFVDPWEDD
jgi:predicted nucleic acid-binding protein